MPDGKDMRKVLLGAQITLLAVAVLTASSSVPSDFQPEFETVLSHDLGFSAGDLTDLTRGRVAKHTLSPRAPEEVGVVGAIRIRGSRDRLIAAYRDIVTFRKSNRPSALAAGRFSEPPGP